MEKGTRNAGLLVAFGSQRRPISAIMLRDEDEVTALIGRATAYLLTGTPAFDG